MGGNHSLGLEGDNVKMETREVGCEVVNSFELAGNRAQ
jgi:hypothetical protein